MPCWRLADVVLLPGGRNWKLMLVWCCCLVVEADADLVLLSGGGSWKLMLVWCCCLVVEAGS